VRVLFVTHNVPRFDGDAAGSFVLRLAVALQQQGHRVDVIAPGGAGVDAEDHLEGVDIERIPYASNTNMTLAYVGTMAESVRKSWSARFALIGLLRALRRATQQRIRQAARSGDRYDVVHAHWWFPAGLALWRAFREGGSASRLPLVITMHGSDVRLAQHTRPAHPIMRAVLAQAAVCTTVSSWLADAVLRIAPEANVTVAPMPVDTRHFRMGDIATPRSGILFVGRLNEQKGLALLVDAMARPSLAGATLDVVGEGPDTDALRARAVSLGIEARIRWHGALPQPALVPLYQRAVCVAMPSREEGLGLVAVEAQLCATPVVAFSSGGLTDVVRPDAGGSLVMPGDVDALSVSIGRLLDDPIDAAARGQAARAFMLAQFAPTHVAQRYAALYLEACRGTR